MTRGTLSTIVYCGGSVIAALALTYVVGRYLGWWVVAAVYVTAIGYGVWWLARLPVRMMPW
jgi:hypothetical protein